MTSVTGAPAKAPSCSIDFTDPVVNDSPWEAWEQVRSLGRVVWNESLNGWLVTGFNDVRKVLRDADRFDSDLNFEWGWGGRIMTTAHGKRHLLLREVFRPGLERGVLLEKWEDAVNGLIRSRAESLAGDLGAGRTIDVAAAARNIARDTILTLLGISEAEEPGIGDKLQEWAHGMSDSINAKFVADPVAKRRDEERGERGRDLMGEYATKLLEGRKAPGVPEDDPLRRLAMSGLDGELTPDHVLYGSGDTPMTPKDMSAQVTMYIQSAQSNTVNGMSLAVAYLAQDPELRAELRQDRELIPAFIEEILRHAGVLQAVPRVVRDEPYELAGVELQPGEFVYLAHAAANRDPSRWERPEVFDIHRDMKAHMSFGFGQHSCLGSGLGRMEIRLLVDAVLDLFGDFELDQEQIPYNRRFIARGPAEVLLRAAG